MDGQNTSFQEFQDNSKSEINNSFSQYLSFRFYKENLEHLTDATKDRINDFLKTITEIEEDFINMLQNQRMKNIELHDFGFESEIYMEENY